ncbi:alpha/beta fold hydrolase [Streptomyces tendae]|uniref:alpha/beta fold hydrolase n=1 Tax=Streptomyces tendae TaxID=1932 RepID=UPI0016721499|nr:alpha/beta hydrolase [Streptomyces tendae]
MLAYETRGSGPGLLLLHGTSSTGTGSWGTLLDALAAGHTVVAPDLPGSGTSPLPVGPLDLDTVADQVVEAAREAGLEEFVVAGASLGAALAVRVAARHAGAVRGLATVVGFARPRTTLRLNLEMWASLYARGDENLGTYLTALSFSEPYLAALPPQAVQQVVAGFGGDAAAPGTAQQIALTLSVDVRGDLSRIAVPTLVVASTEDRFVAPEHSVELADRIDGARLVTVPGGHAAVFEDPGPTRDALLDYLGGLPR